MFVYFDIGGTKTRVSISHDQQTFEEPKKFETPKERSELIERIIAIAHELGGDAPITALGGGIACPVDRETGAMFFAQNLPPSFFVGSFVDELRARTQAQVFIGNDTEVIALGENIHGAAQGCKTVVYMTVSTGVGGACIRDSRIEVRGISAEPGRQIIDFDRSSCAECMDATVQGYVSGVATEYRFHKKPYEVSEPALWEELARWCAYMLNNTIVHWTPDVVVLGGSMITGDPAISTERVVFHLSHILEYPRMPEIREAKLGDIGGIYGAMEFVRQRLVSHAESAL